MFSVFRKSYRFIVQCFSTIFRVTVSRNRSRLLFVSNQSGKDQSKTKHILVETNVSRRNRVWTIFARKNYHFEIEANTRYPSLGVRNVSTSRYLLVIVPNMRQ